MSPPAMTTMTYREACRQAIRDALAADPRCFVMGEDVGKYGGCYAVTKGLLEEFGPEPIRDTPLSELGFVGAGIAVAAGEFDDVAHVDVVAKTHALDHATAGHVEARDDAFGEHGDFSS